jgi:S1-C subfamily serine protease
MSENFTLEQRAAQIVLTAVSPYVVGIFTKRDSSHSFWSNGSGSLVEFKGRKFVLTAAHVVPQSPADIQFVLPP